MSHRVFRTTALDVPRAALDESFALISALTGPLRVGRIGLTPSEVGWTFERLIARTEERGTCWLWHGYAKNGYPVISVHGRHMYGHRLALTLKTGTDPGSLDACHTCDVRRCWAFAHLFAGTRTDNMRDAKAKGRTVDPPKVTGERHPKATLTDRDVADIRAAGSVPQRQLAAAYGVSQSTIWRLQHNKTRLLLGGAR